MIAPLAHRLAGKENHLVATCNKAFGCVVMTHLTHAPRLSLRCGVGEGGKRGEVKCQQLNAVLMG
jgi:hypothetical protein